MIVIGAALQLGGFVLALYQSVSARRRLVPEARSVLVHVGQWLARLARALWALVLSGVVRLLVKLHVITPNPLSASGAFHASFGLSGSLTGYAQHGTTVEERLDWVERELPRIRASVKELRDELTGHVETALAEVAAEQARELTRNVHLQELGIFAFVVGLILSTIGALG